MQIFIADETVWLTHLFFDVLEGGWRHDGEADEEDVGLGIAERPKSVVVLLARCVKES